jgi:uncharacterized repeat protein (TIGR03833 family)
MVKPMPHTNRTNITPGLYVAIVLKADQRTGKLTQGFVQDLLTSKQNHPRGIKVRLDTGEVGRVQHILQG